MAYWDSILVSDIDLVKGIAHFMSQVRFTERSVDDDRWATTLS